MRGILELGDIVVGQWLRGNQVVARGCAVGDKRIFDIRIECGAVLQYARRGLLNDRVQIGIGRNGIPRSIGI